MTKDKAKPSIDKFLLDGVSNKYKLVIQTSRLVREKAKRDGKIKVIPETIMEALYEVANKESDRKEGSEERASKEENVQKKKPEEK